MDLTRPKLLSPEDYVDIDNPVAPSAGRVQPGWNMDVYRPLWCVFRRLFAEQERND